MPTDAIRRALTTLGEFVSHPTAFLIVGGYAILWLYFQPTTFDWHALATLAVWCMTLLIERTERRDTLAIHAKLDELIRSQAQASNRLINVDDEEPEDIERLRDNDLAARSPR